MSQQATLKGVRLRALRVALLLLAPLSFFVCAEFALALLGFGGRPALFVESQNVPGMLEANAKVVARYFPGRETKLAIDAIPFASSKPRDLVRVVVQGGSTAAGFPYGRWAGLAGMLGDRLEAARPAQQVEVITTAMAAVNSYTLLDFVDEIIEVEPDAVLIYAGHNEYLGIFGAGSAITSRRSRAVTRLHLWLSRFRTYQLIDQLIPSAAEAGSKQEREGAVRRDTLMARAASSAEIPFDSKLYREGLLQFEENLGAILDRYQRAGVPVFVGTLVSNEVDQPPFAGGPLEAAAAPGFVAEFAAAQELRSTGALEAARARLETLLARSPMAADIWFALAGIAREQGDVEAARVAYRFAKEFDRLRFRAPEAFNDIVRRLANAYGATVVDVQARLAAQSPLGIVGQELMLEHLHPNARGYFLLADAYYDALEVAATFGPPPREPPPTREEALRDMPLTALDRLHAAQAVREIRSDFPFRPERLEVAYPEPRNPVEAIAKRLYEDPEVWLASMEELLQLYLRRGRLAEACVVARVTAQALPWEAAPNFAAASLLEKRGQLRRALRYYAHALRAKPEDPATLQRIARLESALASRSIEQPGRTR